VNTHHRKHYKKYRDYRKKEKAKREICPVCNKPINKIITAITHKETKKKAHFDCILKELKKYYHLKPNEEVYYLGGGSFGIVEGQKGLKAKSFVVKRKIQYEEKQ
jgi:hypothetical protein